MAFRKVGSGKFKYVKYAECEAGQVLAEGHYLGTREGQFGIQHQVQEESEVAVLNSSGHLNWLLENNVSRGDMIRVVYAGKEKLATGKFKNKEAHRFELEVDDSSKIAVKAEKGGTREEFNDEDEESSEEMDDSNSRGNARSGGLASRSGSSRGLVSGLRGKSAGDGSAARPTSNVPRTSSEDEEGQGQEKGEEEESNEEKRLKEAQDVITKYRTRRA